MPKVKKVKPLEKEIMNEFNYVYVRDKVLNFFAKYRKARRKIDLICNKYRACLSNIDDVVITSNRSDTTALKAEKMIQEQEYIDKVDKSLRKLRLILTPDEKIILDNYVLTRHTDDDLEDMLFLVKSTIYLKKKSCFIKIYLFYNL